MMKNVLAKTYKGVELNRGIIMFVSVCLACRSTEFVARRDRRESLLLLSL